MRPTHCVVPRKCLPSTWLRCSTPPWPGHAEVDRLPGGVGQRAHGPRGQLDQVAARRARRRSGARTGPARKRPRSPCCSTRPLRSSALRSRDAVLFGRPASCARSVSPRGASASSTSASSCAPRSIDAPCPAAGWNSCSMPDILSTAAPFVKETSVFVNEMPRYEILSEEAIETPRQGLAADRLGARGRVRAARGGRVLREGRPARGGREGLPRPGVRARAGGEGAAASSSCRRATRSTRVHIGGDNMVFAGVYGPPFVRKGDGARRRARWRTSRTSCGSASRSPRWTRPAAPSSSRRTGRSTRATSTWSTRSRRCRTSRTWAR